MATGCSSKTKNRSSVLPKPRLRGWVHTVMAPLILLAGVGLMIATPTWGNLIQEARNLTILQNKWWYWIPPGTMIFLSILCFNILGDGLRDAIDPKMQK